MLSRNIASFICIFAIVVMATVHKDSHSVAGSDPGVTVYPLTTENLESSTREPDQQVMETLPVDLGALLDAGHGAVVTLVAGDTRLAAHKAVLAARSPVLAATLQSMTLDARRRRVVIPDVEGPVLRQLLAYIYTLQAPQLPSMAPQLLAAADAYGLSSLKEHCEQQLAAQLSVETAVATAILAVQHSCANLRHAAISFIKTHILHVMATRGWADAMKNQSEVWVKVMQLLPDPPTETSSPAPADSGATPATQPHSDHSDRGQVLSSAVQPTTSRSTFPSVATVPHLRSLSAEEKGRRLIEAAKDGAVEEVEALLAAGADVEATSDSGWTALDWAAVKGHVEVASRLLAAGAAVDTRGRYDWMPLHMAAASGQVAVVRLLVEEAFADVNARTDSGRTPLHWAAYACRKEAVLALLQAGADKGAKDKYGQTPLEFARISPFWATC